MEKNRIRKFLDTATDRPPVQWSYEIKKPLNKSAFRISKAELERAVAKFERNRRRRENL